MAQKTGRSFSKRAQTVMKKYEPRLGPNFDRGDALALEAMNQELEGLQRENEIARVQKLVEGSNTAQLSQLSQILEQPQGPQQPGIPQGGPSGLAGGQAPQATGQPPFGCGGKLRRHQDGGGLTSAYNQLSGENQRLNQLNNTNQNFNQQFQLGRQQEAQRDTMRQQGLAGMKGGFANTGNIDMGQGLFGTQPQQEGIQPTGFQPQIGNPLSQPNIPQQPSSETTGGSRLSRAGGAFNLKGFATGGRLPQYQNGGDFFPGGNPTAYGLQDTPLNVEPWMRSRGMNYLGEGRDQLGQFQGLSQADQLGLTSYGADPLDNLSEIENWMTRPFGERPKWLQAISKGLNTIAELQAKYQGSPEGSANALNKIAQEGYRQEGGGPATAGGTQQPRVDSFPNRASLGLGQGQGRVEGRLGNFQGANRNFPQVQGNEPLGYQGGLGGYEGLSAADKLGLTYRGQGQGGGQGGGAAPATQGGGATGATVTGGGGAATGAGGPRAYALNDPNDPFSGLSAGPRYQDPYDTPLPTVEQALPSLDLARGTTGPSDSPDVQKLGEQLGKTAGGADVEQLEGFNARAPWFGAAAQGLSSILGNRQIEFDPTNPREVVPQKISLAREREGLRRDRDIANSMIRGGAAQGGSRAGLMQNLLAGATGTQRNLGRGLSKTYQTEENVNAQLRGQADMFNAQNQMVADRFDRENMLINQQRRDAQITGVGSAITGYGKDLVAANQYEDQMDLLSAENPDFNFGQEEEKWWNKTFGITPKTRVNIFNTGRRSADN
jgi:hypothetical protein